MKDLFTASDTGKDWFPENTDLYAKPYEIMYFVHKFPELFKDSVEKFKGFDDEVADFLLSYDNLYNSIMISRAFLNYDLNNITKFYELFHTSSAKELIYYFRYIVIEVVWGGFHMERSVHEILWGYEDPFVKKLHYQPVL